MCYGTNHNCTFECINHTVSKKTKLSKMSSNNAKKRKSDEPVGTTNDLVDMVLSIHPTVLAEQVEPSKAIQLYENLKGAADKLEERLRGDNFKVCYGCHSQSSSGDGSRCSCGIHWFCSTCEWKVDRCRCEDVILCRHCLASDPEPCACMQG